MHIAKSRSKTIKAIKAKNKTKKPAWIIQVCAAQCDVNDWITSMYRCCQARFWRCQRFCSSCLPNSSAVFSYGALPVSAPLTESFSSPRWARRTPCWHESQAGVSKSTARVKGPELLQTQRRETDAAGGWIARQSAFFWEGVANWWCHLMVEGKRREAHAQYMYLNAQPELDAPPQ